MFDKIPLDIYIIQIPTLQFSYVQQPVLKEYLINQDQWSGICVTSARAVTAIGNVMEDRMKQAFGLPVFAIGKNGNSMMELGWRSVVCQGNNSNELADQIIQYNQMIKLTKPILYVCSNIRRDSLPNILKNNGIPLQEIIAYETNDNQDLINRFDQLKLDLKQIFELKNSKKLMLFMVFFSPSGVKAVHHLINNLINEFNDKELDVRYIALGEATSNVIKQNYCSVWCVSPAPNASSLSSSIYEKLIKE